MLEEQGDLFAASPEESGYRLNYLELFNWGTFDKTIYRIEPHGKNSLLTGANASGKSTLIDALLTLLVPFKKDRFYNQSSGNDKKGDLNKTVLYGHRNPDLQDRGDIILLQQEITRMQVYAVSSAFQHRKCGYHTDCLRKCSAERGTGRPQTEITDKQIIQ